ncbi:hypothetical protein HAX54_033683 [Datura stramonium]|uniref:Uncharacterized protein n=1 Tax=Datura stramonium TaxID=4076 RepID=A0ABS8SDV8_DATST|nr:hypothetical protein [Datura stramonium]
MVRQLKTGPKLGRVGFLKYGTRILDALLAGDLENVFAEVNEEVDYASAIIPPRVNVVSFKIDGGGTV